MYDLLLQIAAIFALYCFSQVALVNGYPWQARPRTFASVVTLRPKGVYSQQGTYKTIEFKGKSILRLAKAITDGVQNWGTQTAKGYQKVWQGRRTGANYGLKQVQQPRFSLPKQQPLPRRPQAQITQFEFSFDRENTITPNAPMAASPATSYGAPVAEPLSSSYGAPAAEPLGTYGAPAAEPIGTSTPTLPPAPIPAAPAAPVPLEMPQPTEVLTLEEAILANPPLVPIQENVENDTPSLPQEMPPETTEQPRSQAQPKRATQTTQLTALQKAILKNAGVSQIPDTIEKVEKIDPKKPRFVNIFAEEESPRQTRMDNSMNFGAYEVIKL